MSKCPCCKSIANPIRLLTYTRWSPYKCPQCDQTSMLSNIGVGLVCGVSTAIAFKLETVLNLSKPATIFALFALIVALMNILKLKPEESTDEQKPRESSSETAQATGTNEPDR